MGVERKQDSTGPAGLLDGIQGQSVGAARIGRVDFRMTVARVALTPLIIDITAQISIHRGLWPSMAMGDRKAGEMHVDGV